MKKLVSILIPLISVGIFGQYVEVGQAKTYSDKVMDLKFRDLQRITYNPADKSVKGTPYIYPDYVLGMVEGFPETYKMRYNAHLDEVIFNTDDGDMALLKESLYSTVHFKSTKETLKLVNYVYENKEVLGYLFVVADTAGLTIFRKSTIAFLPFVPAANSYYPDSPATFRRLGNIYFIKNQNSQIEQLPSNKNKLIAMFPEKKEAIKQYFKKNKVNLSEEKDLKKLSEIL
ncbi:hypothetical protein FNJ88_08430 [Chryseobacterium sp. SNU WT5]|uniref:hypothetical protein n=1 Tax=Chryseobacterium sp. SNU WT5 TaxID=2594269 RepID=UPI00117C3110|nr:hypothetical protein [Chryseobacterium sp. SNU WT5]QDP85587.1 hypothetical protein FNJ88_08430 [Chryseobacterium sp. SNU WT5]